MKTTEFCNHTARDAIELIAKIDTQSGIGQETYVIEECAELIKELTKKRRGKGNDDAIKEEACDVLTTVLVLLRTLDVPEQQITEAIIRKCDRATKRYTENGEV